MTHPKEVVFECPRFKVVQQRLDEKEYYYVQKPNAVMGLLLKGGKFLFCRHYRPILKTQGLELIGGRVEEGEDPTTALTREIYEEIGLKLEPKHLFSIDPLPSVTTERVHVFFANIEDDFDLEATPHGQDEGIRGLALLSIDEVLSEIHSNNLTSAAEGYAFLRFILKRRGSLNDECLV